MRKSGNRPQAICQNERDTDMMSRQEKILVINDVASIRRLLCRRLSKEGYECEEANSACQALNKLESSPADLVFLDIKMPDKSGIELLPEIKAAYPDTAVIMATSVNETSVGIDCMKLGADDYICKPFDLDNVVLRAKRTLKKKQIQIKISEYQQHLEQEVTQQTKEIRRLFLGAVESLVFALEAKDKYTAGHSRRVAEIALAIGKELGLPADEIEDLRWGSLLHDIGKIAVDQLIQNKLGSLTRDEYQHIMIHGQKGAGIVKPVVNDKVVGIVEHHHDHYNGKGFNQAITGESIPPGARILAVADAFDAMTSDRPYRSAMPVVEALEEVKRCAGTQFDPAVVRALTKVFTREVLAEAG